MKPAKTYIHDRIILLLITCSAFFTLITALLIVYHYSNGRTDQYFIQYRPNLGVSLFQKGGIAQILSFAVFSAIVFVFHLFLSIKVYHIRRMFSVIILWAGLFLIILSLIMSNALLQLR